MAANRQVDLQLSQPPLWLSLLEELRGEKRSELWQEMTVESRQLLFLSCNWITQSQSCTAHPSPRPVLSWAVRGLHQPSETPPEAGADPPGRMGGKCETSCIAGFAMVVRSPVWSFPSCGAKAKHLRGEELSQFVRCVKSVQSPSWQGMSLVSRRHVVLLDKCWFSSQRGFAAQWIDSSWGNHSQTACMVCTNS